MNGFSWNISPKLVSVLFWRTGQLCLAGVYHLLPLSLIVWDQPGDWVLLIALSWRFLGPYPSRPVPPKAPVPAPPTATACHRHLSTLVMTCVTCQHLSTSVSHGPSPIKNTANSVWPTAPDAESLKQFSPCSSKNHHQPAHVFPSCEMWAVFARSSPSATGWGCWFSH